MYSPSAEAVREVVRNCPKQCWMMGSVSQEMKKHLSGPLKWVVAHKWLGQEIALPPRADRHPHGLFGVDGLSAKQTMALVNIRAIARDIEEPAIESVSTV